MSEQSAELRLGDYLNILRRHYRAALLILVVTVAVAVALTVTQAPSYSAQSTILIRTGVTQGLFTPVSGSSYIRQVDNELVVVRSSDYIPENSAGASFAASTPELSSQLVLKVTASTPEDAERLAQEWADNYVRVRREFDIATAQTSIDNARASLDEIQLEEAELLEPIRPLDDALAEATDLDDISRLTTQRLTLIQALDPELQPLRSQRASLSATLASQELLLRSLESDPELGARQVGTPGASDTRAPLTRNVALAVVVGAMLAAGAALALENLRGRIHNEADLARQFPDVTILGSLPYFAENVGEGPLRWDKVSADRAFRSGLESITTSIELIAPTGPFSMVITSAEAGVGKSTTAATLAMAVSTLGETVLLAEGDFRRPRVHEVLETPSRPGVHEVLTQRIRPVDALHWSGSHQLDRLSVMPCGEAVAAPAELLYRTSYRTLRSAFATPFDVTIIDAPPVLPVTDASLIASDVDMTVLVVRAGQTRPAALRSAIDLLARSAKQVSLVFVGSKAAQGNYY